MRLVLSGGNVGRAAQTLPRRTTMNQNNGYAELNRVEKRAIEALAVAPLIRALAGRIGRQEALAILREVNEREAFQRGQNIAAEKKQNGIDALVDDVATWGEGGGWEMEVLEQTTTTYFFNVTRCPYCEKYRELGLEEFGVELSCCRDEPFARGFNPRLRLERTRTIMEGNDHCDFRYYLSPAAPRNMGFEPSP
jgi:hypothetical protein